MKKHFKSISLVASAAVLGTVLLTGCGSSSSTSSTTATGQGAVNNSDGYLGGIGRVILKKANGGIIQDSNLTADSKNKGKIKFGKTLTTGNKIIIKKGGFYFDNNKNGAKDNGEKDLNFDMKTNQGASFASQFTTAAIESNNTALIEAFKDIDPVEEFSKAVDSNNTKSKKLLALGEILKSTYQDGAGSVADVSKVLTNIQDKLEDNVSLDDINGSTLISGTNINPNIAAKADAIKKTVQLVQAVKAKNPDTKLDLDILYAKVSDSGESDVLRAIDATVKDQNLSETLDTNDSTITNLNNDINTTVSNANTATASLPAKLTFGDTIEVGDQTFVINNNTFSGTVSNESNITDFFCVTLPEVTHTKDFNNTDANLTLNVANGDNSLTLTITGAQISQNGESVSVTLPSQTPITASKTGLASLTEISPNGTVTAHTNSPITMDDLKFNVNTILNNLNNSNIASVVAKLDDYLKVSGNTYDINMSLETTLATSYDELTGSITLSDSIDKTKDDEIKDDGNPTITLGTNVLTVTAGDTNSTTVAISDNVAISQNDVISNDMTIATVSYDDVYGKINVTGVKAGTTTITVFANSSSETISVIVEEEAVNGDCKYDPALDGYYDGNFAECTPN